MPKKDRDPSTGWNIFDDTLFKEIAMEDVDKLCREFDLGDPTEFYESHLRHWSATYRNNQKAFRNKPTAAQMRNIVAGIGNAFEKALDELDRAGAQVRGALSHIATEVIEDPDRKAGLQWLIGGGYLAAKEKIEDTHVYQYDIVALEELMKLVAERCDALIPHYDNLKKEHGKQLPAKDMDRRVLIANIAQFWTGHFGKDFTRWFDEYDSVRDQNTKTPKNKCTNFTTTICQIIDPSLTYDKVDKSMAEFIQGRRLKKG